MAERGKCAGISCRTSTENEICTRVSPLATFVLAGSFPLIAKNILCCMPAKSLNTCARVCKEWLKLAREIKKCRHLLSWFLAVIQPCEPEEDASQLAQNIRSYFEHIWCEPETVLAFSTTSLFEEPLMLHQQGPRSPRPCHPRAAKSVKIEIGQYVQQSLPKQCRLLGIVADGAVGTMSNADRSVEVEGSQAITILSLPKIEGVEIHHFMINIYSPESNWLQTIDALQADDVDVSSLSGISPDKKVKSVLFFCNEPFCPPEIGYSIMRTYKDAVVAGGYVDNLILPKSNDQAESEPTILCVAFSGDNLRVASVILRENVKNTEDAEKQISKLKECHFSEERSFAFMFACVGRGQAHYGKQNVESDVFRKLFPKTPIFGFFGNGEVGYNSIPNLQKPESTRDKGNRAELMAWRKKLNIGKGGRWYMYISLAGQPNYFIGEVWGSPVLGPLVISFQEAIDSNTGLIH